MMHPHTELRLINPEIGYGVFATAFIPTGTLVYVKDELEIEIPLAQYKQISPVYRQIIDKYAFIDEQGTRVLSWDHAKYVNHCCQCNTMSTGYGFEIAIRDIQPGEQITDEYGMFNMEHDLELSCSQPNCRRRVTNHDFDLYYPQWDEQIRHALASLRQVSQPLWPLVDGETAAALHQYLETGSAYRSIYTIRYHNGQNPVPAPKLNGQH